MKLRFEPRHGEMRERRGGVQPVLQQLPWQPITLPNYNRAEPGARAVPSRGVRADGAVRGAERALSTVLPRLCRCLSAVPPVCGQQKHSPGFQHLLTLLLRLL